VLGTDPDIRIRDLQEKVDNIDAAIVSFLAERFRCTGAIGALKAKRGRPFRDPDREAALLYEKLFFPPYFHRWSPNNEARRLESRND
jgi:hypothetical protein